MVLLLYLGVLTLVDFAQNGQIFPTRTLIKKGIQSKKLI